MTAGRSPGEPAAADRPAGHDAHQQTAAEVPDSIAEAQRKAHISIAVQREYQRGYEAGRAAERHPDLATALAAAEQRGRDDEKRKVRALLDEHAASTDVYAGLRLVNDLRVLADRTEATT